MLIFLCVDNEVFNQDEIVYFFRTNLSISCF